MGFVTILAKVLYVTGGAGRVACPAHRTSAQKKTMMRIPEVLGRHEFQQLLLHRPHGLAGCQTGAIGDPEYMGVHGDSGFAERRVQNDIGGLSADPRKLLEILAGRGYGAGVPLEQDPAGGNDVPSLAVV